MRVVQEQIKTSDDDKSRFNLASIEEPVLLPDEHLRVPSSKNEQRKKTNHKREKKNRQQLQQHS